MCHLSWRHLHVQFRAGRLLHATESNAPEPTSCHAAFSDKGTRHHPIVRNIPIEDNIFFITAAFPSTRSATTLFLEPISELWVQELGYSCLSILSAPHVTACCSGPLCPCSWENTSQVLHPPSQSDSGAPQTDWSSCLFQRYPSFLPHTGSSRCDILHALAVYPRISWRLPRLFPDTLKAQERSGVSTTGVLPRHGWPGWYCPNVVCFSVH